MTRKGVWNLQQVRDKYLQSLWANNNQLFYWGENNRGDFGQNNRTNYSSPVQVPGTTWGNTPGKSTFYTSGGTANVKEDGTLWMWGSNAKGQLGHNNIIDYSSPVQVGSGTDWSEVLTGNNCTFATKTDGTAWVWGNNYYGKLGINSNTYQSSPCQIPGTTWSTIVPQRYSGIGLKTDGTLWTWGYNDEGHLGQNNTTHYSSPVQVPGTTWSNACGDSDVLAVKTDGTMWAWGKNSQGQLGLNNRTTYSSPVQVGSDTTWSDQFNTVYSSSGATKTDGTLWAWGYNGQGQSGQNNRTAYSSPVQVGSGTDWNFMSLASYRMTAIKTDGTLWIWGENQTGTLGLNQANEARYSSPVQIPGTWGSVRLTSNYSFGIKKSLTPSQL